MVVGAVIVSVVVVVVVPEVVVVDCSTSVLVVAEAIESVVDKTNVLVEKLVTLKVWILVSITLEMNKSVRDFWLAACK